MQAHGILIFWIFILEKELQACLCSFVSFFFFFPFIPNAIFEDIVEKSAYCYIYKYTEEDQSTCMIDHFLAVEGGVGNTRNTLNTVWIIKEHT